MVSEIISFIFLSLYFFLISVFIFGFIQLKSFSVNKKIKKNIVKISVLIPFKNGQINLPLLVSGLKTQTLDTNLYEIIFINDHSEDKSETLLSDLITDIPNFRILSLQNEKNGKKQALKEGIRKAENELIVTSDADCRYQKKWLETIYNYYSEHNPKMIIAPVIMTGTTFFGRLQALDFLSLAASAAGAAGIGHPIMCNGANLVYEKAVFNEFEDAMYMNEISGDDVFLLHNFKKKYPEKIHYLKSEDAVVYTKSEKTFNKFSKQRIRWASKSSSYTDFDTIFVSIIVFIINLILISAVFLTLFKVLTFNNLFILFLIKFIPDIILLITFGIYFKQRKLLFYIPFLSIIHPFYIVFTGITGLLKKSKQ
ncbi:MAG: glycosyltransferase [Chlorobi bacterium]|nr:glycosyltransferase [Chlorobiota bacterium]